MTWRAVTDKQWKLISRVVLISHEKVREWTEKPINRKETTYNLTATLTAEPI